MPEDNKSNCTNPCYFTTDVDTCQGRCNRSNTECTTSTGCTTLPTGIILWKNTSAIDL